MAHHGVRPDPPSPKITGDSVGPAVQFLVAERIALVGQRDGPGSERRLGSDEVVRADPPNTLDERVSPPQFLPRLIAMHVNSSLGRRNQRRPCVAAGLYHHEDDAGITRR